MKITKITPEQTAQFGEWTKKWIEIGLSTEPADFDKAAEAALKAYALCNLARPKVILRMSSPYGATLGGALAWVFLNQLRTNPQVGSQVWSQVGSQIESQIESQVGSQVWSQVGSQIESQVGSQIESQVGSQVWSQVGSQVGSQIESQVGSQVRSQVWSQVWSQVGSQVRSQVWSQVWSQIESQVGSQVRSQVWSQIESQVYNDRGGSFWAGWGAYVSFIRDVLGWVDPVLDRFSIDEDLIKSCGWVWWHEDVLAIADRPASLCRDDRGRLHNETGPSIAYRDGWALWHWHGVSVPQDVIERPADITSARIEKEENAEVRRVMIERYGYARYVKKSKVVHEDHTGKLRKRRNKKGDEIAVVEVINGSKEPTGEYKRYFLAVPPTCQTAIEAVSWTYGLSVDEYKGLRVRT